MKKAEGITKATSAGYKCPVSSPEFLKHAVPQTFKLTLKPVKFSSGKSFGWTSYSVAKIEAGAALDDKILITNVTCNAIVLLRQGKAVCSLNAAKFLKEAKKLKIKIEAEAYEFSTGSFGWQAHRREKPVVCGEELQVQVNLNAVVRGSKPKDAPSDSSDPVLKDLGPKVLSKSAWATIGKATAKDKDDLKKIKGIGPFIEKRLNKIGLYTFEQISRMAKIEKDVTKAIVYFPGRHRRDNWIEQAEEEAAKTK
jgi:predicted flap endonuclease-1-like 5' DNA nuclease